MENRNSILEFTRYIESLCKSHELINHREDETHFLELGNDQQLQASKKLYFPLVTLESLSNTYSDIVDSVRKKRSIEMMFLDHVSDAGDFESINLIWNKMESIAEDFILKLKQDRSDRSCYSFLGKVKISNIELNLVENVATHLWGALLSFELDMPFNECLPSGRFK